MLTWGWRIPFFCAFLTALLGAFLRRSMPEPHAFLTAARLANKAATEANGGSAADDGAPSVYAPSSKDMDVEVAHADGRAPSTKANTDADEDDESVPEGALEVLHGHANVRTPILRLLRNNMVGLGLHICFMAWWVGRGVERFCQLERPGAGGCRGLHASSFPGP
jgi:hypothetical protein